MHHSVCVTVAAISTRSLLNCDKKFNTLEQVIILPQPPSSQQRQTERAASGKGRKGEIITNEE